MNILLRNRILTQDYRKEYKRKRAEQIFTANDRGIFQTNEEGETEVTNSTFI